MDDVKERLIRLSHCRGAGWKTMYRLLMFDRTLEILDKGLVTEMSRVLHVSRSTANELLKEYHSKRMWEQIRAYSHESMHIIAIFDDLYPYLLKQTFQPPWLLYAKGDVRLLKRRRKMAVVGSRQATAYGKIAINQLLPELIKREVVIVSGLAKGIDTVAHEAAIRLKGKTIAVIAGGIQHIYPNENIPLARQLMAEHLLISEYPPATKPARWQFPLRNRIISGLTFGTIVVEAKKRSGSFITADIALNEGREVFAVPGNINQPQSEGSNRLIQKGAKLVVTVEDILEELPNYF